MKLQKTVLYSLICLGFFYLLVLQIQAVWQSNVDDAYISLRYAKNWAAGYGLVWNVGEAPVEGYSNFLFVFFAYVAFHLDLNPLLVLKIAGAIGLGMSALALYGISRTWAPRQLAWIPSAWLLLYGGEIVWCSSGLETGVYQAFLCAAVYFIFRGMGFRPFPQIQRTYQTVSFIIAALCLACAGMTRPEAPAVMALFFMVLVINGLFLQGKSRADFFKNVIVFSVVLFLAYAPYFAWRLIYYGRLFPNPIYCKGIAPLQNFILIKDYWILIWPFIILSLPAIWTIKDSRHWFLWLPSILYTLLLMHSDPIVAFYNRLFLPAFALILPLAFQGMKTVLLWYIKEQKGIYDTVVYFVAFIVSLLCIPSYTLAQYRQYSEPSQEGEHLRLQLADWILHNIPADRNIVLGDTGLVPALTPHAYIDSYCLNNAEMTRNPSPKIFQDFCQQILQQSPNAVVLTSLVEKNQVFYAPADACLAKLLPKNNQYRKAISLQTKNQDSFYRYEIYIRN